MLLLVYFAIVKQEIKWQKRLLQKADNLKKTISWTSTRWSGLAPVQSGDLMMVLNFPGMPATSIVQNADPAKVTYSRPLKQTTTILITPNSG